MEIWSPGKLPPGITVDKLRGEHESIPPNPFIAKPFFLIGYIENWETGTNRTIRECVEYGHPEPEFRETGTSFVITFRKHMLSEEYLVKMGLNERQVKALMYLKEKGKITNKEYRGITGLSDEGARIDMNDLVAKGLLKSMGSGRGTYYILSKLGN